MKYSLRSKLTVSYIFITLICVGIISISSNVMLEKQFKKYVINQQENKSIEIVENIKIEYLINGQWDINYIENIGMNALERGLIIRINDLSGNLIWDATIHNDGLCQQMLLSMRTNMQSYISEDEGGYEEKEYELVSNGVAFGSLTVGYYGPYFFTDSDLYFITNINKLLIWSGVVSLIIAVILGIIISDQLARPITRVIDKATDISKGLFKTKIPEKSNTIEIQKLSKTMNNLSDTLKKQQDFSRQTSVDIAHELRTPLTTVQGNLEAVLDGLVTLDNNRIEIIYNEIIRINRIVDDLGKLARYESENFILKKSRFDLSKIISHTIESFGSEPNRKGKTIIYKENPVYVLADKDKIHRVIVNLLSNALNFTEDNGKIEITATEKGSEIEMVVKDNGIGISDEDLPLIFERFYRSEKSRSRSTGGSGIGLSIIKSIVLAHNGTITVNSRPNTGSEFVVRIPRN